MRESPLMMWHKPYVLGQHLSGVCVCLQWRDPGPWCNKGTENAPQSMSRCLPLSVVPYPILPFFMYKCLLSVRVSCNQRFHIVYTVWKTNNISLQTIFTSTVLFCLFLQTPGPLTLKMIKRMKFLKQYSNTKQFFVLVFCAISLWNNGSLRAFSSLSEIDDMGN